MNLIRYWTKSAFCDMSMSEIPVGKVGSSGEETIEFAQNNPIEIDNLLEVSITGLGEYSNQDTVIGGIPSSMCCRFVLELRIFGEHLIP